MDTETHAVTRRRGKNTCDKHKIHRNFYFNAIMFLKVTNRCLLTNRSRVIVVMSRDYLSGDYWVISDFESGIKKG